ncbi:MAG TPA: glycosyltransferase family 4 protein [bacterium]|nr:glycosyltransferase family 4 protein [bacterium]
MTSSRKIRVAHIITRLIRGGADENTVFTVLGMDRERYEVDILAGHGSELSGFPIEIHRCTKIVPELVRDPHPIRDLIALAKITRLLRQGRYDLVHTHTAKAGFLGRLGARLAGVPCVVHTLHGVTFHEQLSPLLRRAYIFLERIAAPLSDVLISVGEDVKGKYLRESIGREDQYVTIPSGMDTVAFRRARCSPDQARFPRRCEFGFEGEHMVVGMVSRLEPRKGYRYFFEALARVSEDFPQVRALVVGEGEQGHELKSMAADLGIGERVVFAGYRADIAEVIAAFDVALLTSLWEGLPRVLVQYALLEKPIVTFDVEGAREVIDDGNSGYIVPLQDVDLLADRLRQLLESETLRRRLGVAARERVEGRWDVDRMVAGIAEVYRRVESARIPEKELSASR